MQKNLTILTGASRGMGLAMAQQLLAPDAVLLCISRQTNAALQQQAADCGAELLQWQADLSEPEPVAERLREWLQALDPAQLASATLINNAGVLAFASVVSGDPKDLMSDIFFVAGVLFI